jgi:hypothetical protein
MLAFWGVLLVPLAEFGGKGECQENRLDSHYFLENGMCPHFL